MTAGLKLDDLVTKITGIGPSAYIKLQKKGIEKVVDLLRLYPLRYENYTLVSPIAKVQPGESVTIIGKVLDFNNQLTTKRNLQIQKAIIKDNSGEIELIWFNQPFLRSIFRVQQQFCIAGRVAIYQNHRVIYPQEYEEGQEPTLHTGRLVPYYTQTFGFSSKFLRTKINYILRNLGQKPIKEYLNMDLIDKMFWAPNKNFSMLHFPDSQDALDKAWQRVRFEELVMILLKQKQLKVQQQTKTAFAIRSSQNQFKQFRSLLPFKLTKDQEQACTSIQSHLCSQTPMDHLLLGEVGSGKTVIAAFSIFLAWHNQLRSIFLVPTEILAEQHYQTFKKLFKTLDIKIGLLTSKRKLKAVTKYDLVIGTHALLHLKKASRTNGGLVVIDEQHKFGVQQRTQALKLFQNKTKIPHLLSLSATPIPRSLAILITGHLSLSLIQEKPIKEQQIDTYIVPEGKRQKCYGWIEKQILERRIQAFVICPLIEESTSEKMNEIKSVKQEYSRLTKYLSSLKIGSVYSHHPKRNEIINKFIKNEFDVLVSTSIIEVGMDIKNVNIMIIENAERFGLAQLHQMRGRIGRSDQQASCFLFTQNVSTKATQRLNYLKKNNNGFKLAELDLKLRGPGNLIGLKQHGFKYLTVDDLLDKTLLRQAKKQIPGLLEKHNQIGYTCVFSHNQKDITIVN